MAERSTKGNSEAKRSRGRPSKYTPAVAATICERLAAGESLRAICRDGRMPPESTVREWVLDNHHGFSAQYARAREAQADTLFDEILEIADDRSRDFYVDEDGIRHVDHEHIQRARLRFDARRWYLSKFAPKRYADRLDLKHGADDGLTALLSRLSPTVGPPGERAPAHPDEGSR